jgi:hypothetical protein
LACTYESENSGPAAQDTLSEVGDVVHDAFECFSAVFVQHDSFTGEGRVGKACFEACGCGAGVGGGEFGEA